MNASIQTRKLSYFVFSTVFPTKDIGYVSCSFSGSNPAAGTQQFPGNTFGEASVSNKKTKTSLILGQHKVNLQSLV